jgi:hypothetical protein
VGAAALAEGAGAGLEAAAGRSAAAEEGAAVADVGEVGGGGRLVPCEACAAGAPDVVGAGGRLEVEEEALGAGGCWGSPLATGECGAGAGGGADAGGAGGGVAALPSWCWFGAVGAAGTTSAETASTGSMLMEVSEGVC